MACDSWIVGDPHCKCEVTRFVYTKYAKVFHLCDIHAPRVLDTFPRSMVEITYEEYLVRDVLES